MKMESINNMAEVLDNIKLSLDVFIMPSSNIDRRKIYPLQPFNGNFFSKSQKQIGLCCNPQQFKGENGMNIHISCG
jgi:DNA polymerase II small subunit/DNA polymerase delta subunit B